MSTDIQEPGQITGRASFLSPNGQSARLAAPRRGGRGRAAPDLEHDVAELENRALVGRREFLDTAQPFQEPGRLGQERFPQRFQAKISLIRDACSA